MFQLSLFTEFGRLCNPFDYVLGFTFLLMAFHLLFLLFNLRERQRVKLFCLGSASLEYIFVVNDIHSGPR